MTMNGHLEDLPGAPRRHRGGPSTWFVAGAAALTVAGGCGLWRISVSPRAEPRTFTAVTMNGTTHMTEAPGEQAGRPATSVKEVSCNALPNAPGKSITTDIVFFPGGFTPTHHHPGSVTVFVLKGTIRSQLAGGAAHAYTVGQTWFEPPGATHVFAENASPTAPAELLAIFVANSNCGPLSIPGPAPEPG